MVLKESDVIKQSFICYKQSFIRYMIVDILVKHDYVNPKVGFLNIIVKYKDKSYQMFDKTYMGDVLKEIDYLIKVGVIEKTDTIIMLTDCGKDLARSATFESIYMSCLSSYTSLLMSKQSTMVGRMSLYVSLAALIVAVIATAPLLIKLILNII